MGVMVDTNVFIRFEKSGKPIDLSAWDASTGIFVSAVTVSELLIGVHRADTDERRRRRSLFVEAVIASVDVLEFDLASTRIHAEIYAELAKSGQMIGAHDLLIAAIAHRHDLSILTDNVAEFSRVPGLRVVPFSP
jgi:predicted nucleic acid-binding protein